MYLYLTVSVQDVRFGTGLCTGEFPEWKWHVFIFRLQLHVQPIYVMANASEKTQLEHPLLSPAWEHCNFMVNITTEKDVFLVWQFNWCSFYWCGSQVWWRLGLRILSRQGSSPMCANQGKHWDHPAHRSKSCICIFMLMWLEQYYSTRRCWGLRPANQLDERYRAQNDSVGDCVDASPKICDCQ